MKLRFWYTVFGTNACDPDLLALIATFRPRVPGVVPQIDVDQCWQQWQKGVLVDPAGRKLVQLTRYWPGDKEFDKRLELVVAEVAKLEAEVNQQMVLSKLNRTFQIINVMPLPVGDIGKTKQARICEQSCGYLTRAMDGLIQVHQEGFFDESGRSLLPCRPQHKLVTNSC